MKRPTTYKVLRFWKKVTLKEMPFHTTFNVVPERKIRSDAISDTQFDAIVSAVKQSGCEWELYTIEKKMIETSTAPVELLEQVAAA